MHYVYAVVIAIEQKRQLSAVIFKTNIMLIYVPINYKFKSF